MPWSPIPKIPNIIKNLNQKKYKNAASIIALENAIMTETGLVGQQTITNLVRVMTRLGYARPRPDGAMDLAIDAIPFNWYKDPEQNQPEQGAE